MARWLVFGEQILGAVEAPHRDAAQAAAYARFTDHPISRVQSEASYLVGEDERRAAVQRRRVRSDPDTP